MMDTKVGAVKTATAAWLETPLLRFTAVDHGQSLAMPIIVCGIGNDPSAIEVIAPPLAPFSVIERPSDIIGRPAAENGSGPDHSGDWSSAELWIRYDATSPMAVDNGQVTIGHRQSGRRWTVALDGTGVLAQPAY